MTPDNDFEENWLQNEPHYNNDGYQILRGSMQLIDKTIQVEKSVDAAMQDVLLIIKTVKALYANGKTPGIPEIVGAALVIMPKLGASLVDIQKIPADMKEDLEGSLKAVVLAIPEIVAALKG